MTLFSVLSMKVFIVFFCLCSANSFAQSLKEVAVQKLVDNNSETSKTGLIPTQGILCNTDIRFDDGSGGPETSAIRMPNLNCDIAIESAVLIKSQISN